MTTSRFTHPSRRGVLKAGAAALGASAFAMPMRPAGAQILPQRPSLASAAGEQMLALYDVAVFKMKDPAINLPNPPAPWSWTFQAYIHSFPIDPTNDQSNAYHPGTPAFKAKIDEIYGASPIGEIAEWKEAALKCWSTCTHGSVFFLPWHRWYMFYFEEVIREVLGVPTFMLPYWPYASNETTSLQLPLAFRIKETSLYLENRGYGFRNGAGSGEQDVLMNDGGHMMYSDIDYKLALATPPYFPADVTIFGEPGTPDWDELGYTGRTEIQPHDNVHDGVGGLMGNVPTAAQDPIFFMHHCQIDHLWASWQSYPDSTLIFAPPPGTPDFPSEQTWTAAVWNFVDGKGKLKTAEAPGALDYAKLGYQYDSLVPQPSAPPILMAAAAQTPAATRPTLASANTVAVQAGGTTAALTLSAAGLLRAAPTSQKLSLVLRDVRLINRPNGNLSVFVNLPQNTPATAIRPERVGQLSLFKLVAQTDSDPHAAHTQAHDAHVHAVGTFTFPLSEVLAQQQANGQWDGASPIQVTITTTGSPETAGTVFVEIGAIEIR